ncbi:hypothetical protein ACA910_000821 [Epithemia clementina (nom. ined.)]
MIDNLLVVVTGASRGLGRAIAIAFHSIPTSSVKRIRTILMARSIDGLKETRRLIQQEHQSDRENEISINSFDLGDLDNLNHTLDNMFETLAKEDTIFDRVVFVNNAGSLGKLGTCLESNSLAEMKKAVDFNVTSSLWCTVRFAQFVASTANQKQQQCIGETTIVNISSLAAIQPLPGMAIYSSGKAARDMYHACLAKELERTDDEQTTGNIKILNYAPGPLETDMMVELQSAEGLDVSLKQSIQQNVVDTNKSATALVRLVLENSFTSGSHIDYFDL